MYINTITMYTHTYNHMTIGSHNIHMYAAHIASHAYDPQGYTCAYNIQAHRSTHKHTQFIS